MVNTVGSCENKYWQELDKNYLSIHYLFDDVQDISQPRNDWISAMPKSGMKIACN